MIRKKIFIMLFVLILITSCSTNKTPTSSIRPTEATITTPTSKMTATNSPTQTPTLSPTPTINPTKTKIPDGFYFNYTAGFSLEYPQQWLMDEEYLDMVSFWDSISNISFYVFSEFGELITGNDIEEKLFDLIGISEEDKENIIISNLKEIVFANISSKNITIQIGKDRNPTIFDSYYINGGSRNYFVIIVGNEEDLLSKQRVLIKIMNSFNVFSPKPYGFEDHEALVQMTYFPNEKGLDPATTTGSTHSIVGLLYSGLVQYSPNMELIPDLAERWEISEDNKTYTFYLNQKSSFSSGDKITSKIVKSSWERLCNPEIKSETAETYLGDIEGMAECLSGESSTISGITIINDFTFSVDLVDQRPYFLSKLTYPTAMIVNTNIVNFENDTKWVYKPDSSGAYMVQEWNHGEALILNKNPNYHKAPEIENLVFYYYIGGNSISLYEEGILDIVYVSNDEIERVSDITDALNPDWLSSISMCTYMLMINPEVEPFNDIGLRKALALAIDKNDFIDTVYQGRGLAADTILPPSMPGYKKYPNLFLDEDFNSYWEESKYFGENLSFDFYIAGDIDTQRDDIVALVNTWQEKLNISVNIVNLDIEKFDENVKKANAGIIQYGWCADYPDPQNFLGILFGEGSKFNITGFTDEVVENLLSEANSLHDPLKRIKLYQQAEERLLENVFVIPLSHGEINVLVNSDIKNYTTFSTNIAIEKWLSYDNE